MKPLKNTEEHYGEVIVLFHWVMAILIIGLSILGIYMDSLPISLQKLRFYGWHKEFGLLVLFIVVFRLVWRMMNVMPKLPEHVPQWQAWAAHMMHRVLYLFMFMMPITGWALTSAAGLPASFFGLFVLPSLVSANKELMHTFVWLHKWIGYAFIGAILSHTGAALKHHFWDKDDVLRGILP